MAVSISALAELKQQIATLQKTLAEVLTGLEASSVERFKQTATELVAQSDVQEDNCLPEWYCPISNELILDPVIATDGHTYERAEIVRWFSQHNTSPITKEECGNALIRNLAIYNQIEPVLKPKLTQLKRGLEALLNEVTALKSVPGFVNSKKEETPGSMPAFSSARPSSLTAFDDSFYTPEKVKPITSDLKRGLSIGGKSVGNELIGEEEHLYTSDELEQMGILRHVPSEFSAVTKTLSRSSSIEFSSDEEENDSIKQWPSLENQLMFSSSTSVSTSSSSSSSAMGLSFSSGSTAFSANAPFFSSVSTPPSVVPSFFEIRCYADLQGMRDELQCFSESRYLADTTRYKQLRDKISNLYQTIQTQLAEFQQRYPTINDFVPQNERAMVDNIVPYLDPEKALDECLNTMKELSISNPNSMEPHIYTPNYHFIEEQGVFKFQSDYFSPVDTREKGAGFQSLFEASVVRLEQEIQALGLPGTVTVNSGINKRVFVTFHCNAPKVLSIAAMVLRIESRFRSYPPSFLRSDSSSIMVSSASSLSALSGSNPAPDRRNNDAKMAGALEAWSLSSFSPSGAPLFSERLLGIEREPTILSPLEVRHYAELKNLRDKLYGLKTSFYLETPKYEKLRKNIVELEAEVRVAMLRYKETYTNVDPILLEKIVPPCKDVQEAMQNCLNALRGRFPESTVTHIYTPIYKLSLLFGKFESEVFSPRNVQDLPQSLRSSFFSEIIIDDGAHLQEEIDYLGMPGIVESAMMHQYKSGNATIRGVRVIFDCDDAMVWNIAAALERMRQEFSLDPQMAAMKSRQCYEAMRVIESKEQPSARVDYHFNIRPLERYGRNRPWEITSLYRIVDNLTLTYDDKIIQFCLEIPGERAVRRREDGHACLVVFDVTDRCSFEHGARTLRDLPSCDREAIFILIGANCLSSEARQVTREEAQNAAVQTGHEYIEISSQKQFNLDSLFSLLCQRLISSANPVHRFNP